MSSMATLPALPLPPVGAPWPPYARFWRRVGAALLDDVLLSAVAWLAFPLQPVLVPTPSGEWGPRPPSLAPFTWPEGLWAVAALVLVVALQGWTGSSPGKLVVGIAVVGDDARPVGVLRTVVRSVLHVLDGLLVIGYLRVLWHPRRRTFADSLAGTVVVVTRRPLPFGGRPFGRARRAALAGPPPAPELARVPAWRARLAVAAGVACAVAVPYGVGVGGTDGARSATADACAGTLPQGRIFDAVVTVRPARVALHRAGTTRWTDGTDPGVEVEWVVDGPQPEDASLRLTLEGAGTRRTVTHDVVDHAVLPGEGTPLEGRLGVRLPAEVLDGLGDAWTWRADVVTGAQTATCTGTWTTA